MVLFINGVKNPDKKFKPRKVPETERIAYHEAGHVFVINYYDKPYKYVTIIPKGDTLGVVHGDLRSKLLEKHFEFDSKIHKVIQKLMIAYAGVLSDALFSGIFLEGGFQSDSKKLGSILVKLIPEDQERDAFFNWIELRTFNLLSFKFNWLQIKAIADSLLIKQKLTRDEISDILYDCIRNNKVSIDNLPSPPGLR